MLHSFLRPTKYTHNAKNLTNTVTSKSIVRTLLQFFEVEPPAWTIYWLLLRIRRYCNKLGYPKYSSGQIWTNLDGLPAVNRRWTRGNQVEWYAPPARTACLTLATRADKSTRPARRTYARGFIAVNFDWYCSCNTKRPIGRLSKRRQIIQLGLWHGS